MIKLAEWKKRQISSDQYDLLIRQPNGGIPDPHTITSEIRKLVIEVGYLSYSFHDLRHAHAALLLMGKVPMKIEQEFATH